MLVKVEEGFFLFCSSVIQLACEAELLAAVLTEESGKLTKSVKEKPEGKDIMCPEELFFLTQDPFLDL